MKKALILPLALAALAAGCSSDDPGATAKSPWSTDGNSGSSGNPIARPFYGAAKDQFEVRDVQKFGPYSWDRAPLKSNAAPSVSVPVTVPEDAKKIRITGIRGELGLFSFLRAEKPEVEQILVVSKDKYGAQVRVVHVENETVVAELLPNQLYVPTLIVGEEVDCRPVDAVLAAAR
jgi:hypothetical protein